MDKFFLVKKPLKLLLIKYIDPSQYLRLVKLNKNFNIDGIYSSSYFKIIYKICKDKFDLDNIRDKINSYSRQDLINALSYCLEYYFNKKTKIIEIKITSILEIELFSKIANYINKENYYFSFLMSDYQEFKNNKQELKQFFGSIKYFYVDEYLLYKELKTENYNVIFVAGIYFVTQKEEEMRDFLQAGNLINCLDDYSFVSIFRYKTCYDLILKNLKTLIITSPIQPIYDFVDYIYKEIININFDIKAESNVLDFLILKDYKKLISNITVLTIYKNLDLNEDSIEEAFTDEEFDNPKSSNPEIEAINYFNSIASFIKIINNLKRMTIYNLNSNSLEIIMNSLNPCTIVKLIFREMEILHAEFYPIYIKNQFPNLKDYEFCYNGKSSGYFIIGNIYIESEPNFNDYGFIKKVLFNKYGFNYLQLVDFSRTKHKTLNEFIDYLGIK